MGYSLNFKKLPPLSHDDAEFLRSMESAQKLAIRMYMEGLESELMKRLKVLCGGVPSPEEIRQHAICGIHPDGTREFKWKGETILRVAPIFTPPAHFS